MTDPEEWARRIAPAAFRRRPGEVDLVAAEPDPAFRAAALKAADDFAAAQTLHLDALERRWRREAPGRARPAPGRSLAILAAVVAAAIAFALVFSRAHLDLEAVAPWFAILIAVAVIASAAAVLPLGRDPGPSFRDVIVTAVGPAAAAAGILAALVASSPLPGGPVWWTVAGVSGAVGAVLLCAVLVTRARAPQESRAEADSSLEDRAAARSRELDEVGRVWVGRLQKRWDEVDPASREEIRGRLRAATLVLRGRDLVSEDREHLPGLLLLEAESQRAGSRLDPSLEGFPDPR